MNIVFTKLITIINNNAFLSVMTSFIIVLLCTCFLTYTIKLLGNIRLFIVNKANSIYISNQKNMSRDNATLSMPDRVELTNSILDLISFSINSEIISHFKSYISLNTPYDISRMDDDVKVISELVFNGVKPSVFTDSNLLFTKEYLMSFITKKTISTLLDIAETHNSKLRGVNQSTEE